MEVGAMMALAPVLAVGFGGGDGCGCDNCVGRGGGLGVQGMVGSLGHVHAPFGEL
jgi:hypothetical protein